MIFGGGHGKGEGIVASVTATATTGGHTMNGQYHKKPPPPPVPEDPPRSRKRSESASTRTTSTSRGRSKSLRRWRPTVSEDSLDNIHDDEVIKPRHSTSSTRPPRSSGSGVVNSMDRGIGSVKKRFSMLKLRGKSSKADVKGNPKFGESVSEVGSVAEE